MASLEACNIAQLLERLPVKHGALNSIPSTAYWYPTTGEVEAREPEIQEYPQLNIELEISLGHTRPCLSK